MPQIEGVIDEEKKVAHSKLGSKTEDVIMDPSKIKYKVKDDKVDICYIPMVQSGGEYDLRPSVSFLSTLRARWVTLGDAKSSLGDATSSLGDAESSRGDAKSSLGDAESSLGDT